MSDEVRDINSLTPSPSPWSWGSWDRATHTGDLTAADGTLVLRITGILVPPYQPPRNGDATLIRLAPELATMLRRLEWAGAYTDGNDSLIECCPVCGEDAPDEPESSGSHAPTCDLATLLREIGP